MARDIPNSASENQNVETEDKLTFDANGQDHIDIPAGKFISDSEITRDGQDLSLEASDGDKLVIENYFSAQEAPVLQSPDGSILTENLVNSFLQNSDQYAQMGTLNDESPIGAVEELEGSVTITRADGSTETATLGTPIYEGDIVETSGDGAVNILFLDETSMAVSENARMSVDNYKFDAATESGETNLSVLRGVFVYTSGLIGRDDPDDVLIETPVGSIGIRGTIIAGNINPQGKSEITVLEGAIVVSNGEGEVTLSQQFETVKINGFNDNIEPLGVKDAGEMKNTYGSVSDVIPKLFSSINDAERENNNNDSQGEKATEGENQESGEEVLEVKPEDTDSQKDANPENIDPIMENKLNVDQEVIQKDGAYNKKPARGLAKDGLKRFHNEGHDKDFSYNQLNPQTQGNDDTGSVFGNIHTSAVVSGAVTYNPYVGDFNGDGQNDQIIADPNANGNDGIFRIMSGAGGALVNANGISGERLGENFELVGDLDNNGQLDFIVSADNLGFGKYVIYEIGTGPNGGQTGSNSGDKLAESISSLGDFDGDGLSDYVVGAPGVNSGDGQVTIVASLGNVNLGAISANEGFGAHVESLGDINNDGFTDLLVGTENPDGTTGHYKAHIFLGDDTSVTLDATITSPLKIVAGGGIGDINGDGFDDFAVSLQNSGSVITYAVYGKATLGNMNLVYLSDPNNALRVVHDVNLGSNDYTVHGVGDKNGDGYDDFQIGVEDGPKYVIHGQNTGNTVIDDDSDSIITAGGTSESLVGDVAAFDDGNHFGISMKGGQSQNDFFIHNEDFSNIDGGLGQDTINIAGNLDFTNVNFEQISQIDKIAIGGTDGVILTTENLFNLIKSSDNNRLVIEGDSGASLTINSGAGGGTTIDQINNTLGSTHSVQGAFDVFTVGSYSLYIEQGDVTVSVV